MQRILFVNGCVRGEESRSLLLARHFLKAYRHFHPEAEVLSLDLTQMDLRPLNPDSFRERNNCLGQWQKPSFSLALQFRDADLVVIAAPFWNGSFPACVHTFLEHICVPGLTFDCVEERYSGLCSAKNCILITTRGGRYENDSSMLGEELATPILQSVMRMLGVPAVTTLAAEGLDLPFPGSEPLLRQAMVNAASLAETLP